MKASGLGLCWALGGPRVYSMGSAGLSKALYTRQGQHGPPRLDWRKAFVAEETR